MKILLILLLSISIYAKDTLYFLPEDSKDAINKIEKLIKNSKKSIDIAIYNIKYERFAKLLDKAQKRGVKVTLLYDKKDVDFKYVDAKKVDKKLHTKIAIFDKKTVIFGSPNWSKKSFKTNYEVLYVSDDEKLLKKFNKFFTNLSQKVIVGL